MQLIAEQFGGDACHLQSSMQSSCYSSNKEALAQQGASLSYTSEIFSSSATFQPPRSSQRGDCSFPHAAKHLCATMKPLEQS